MSSLYLFWKSCMTKSLVTCVVTTKCYFWSVSLWVKQTTAGLHGAFTASATLIGVTRYQSFQRLPLEDFTVVKRPKIGASDVSNNSTL